MPILKGACMYHLRIHARSYGRNFEVSPEEVENAELATEDAVCLALLEHFEEAAVDEISVSFSTPSQMGQRHCSIGIQAQCSDQPTKLQHPFTKESLENALEQSMNSTLKELFGAVTVDSISIRPSFL